MNTTSALALAAAAFFTASAAHAATYVTMPSVGGEAPARATSSAPTEVTTEPQEASGDYFLKIDTIEGESEEKKGKVEYEWKVEEGEKAEEESGEKGGTEDINIGVGELQESEEKSNDRLINAPPQDGWGAAKGGVSVAAGDVNGLTEEEKQAFLAQVKEHAEVQSEQDLQNFAKGVLLENAAMEEISLNYEKIKVTHRSNGKLFGFIPLSFTQDVEIDTEGDDAGHVKVKMPWYSFLMATDVSAEELEEAVSKEKDGHKEWIDIASWSLETRAEVLTMLSEVLKSTETQAADDAASSLQSSMGF